MTPPMAVCVRCEAEPGTVQIGTNAVCEPCRIELDRDIEADTLGSVDDLLSYQRPEGYVDHVCGECGYGWVGPVNERCPRCVDQTPLGSPESHVSVELIDWSALHDHGDEIVDGLLLPGRWTAIAAKAKAGKTTLQMFVSVQVSEGLEPFDCVGRAPVTVLYVDGEMGRFDLEERIRDLGHRPADLERWHATDLPPRLDTLAGGMALVAAASQLGAEVVVIDGINGTVEGAEKDDTTWRAFFDHTIAPLKRAGVAVLTGDNLGKDEALGPRGSSVKVDKPDAVIQLKRTDNGVKLTTTHRRTSAYPLELHLVIEGTEGDQPVTFRRTATSWPNGTTEAVALLDSLGVDPALGRGKVRAALEAAGEDSVDPDQFRVRNDALAAAIRYRRLHDPSVEEAA